MARNFQTQIKPVLDQYFDLSNFLEHDDVSQRDTFQNVVLRRQIGEYPAGLKLLILDVFNRPNQFIVNGFIPNAKPDGSSKLVNFSSYLPL